MIFSKYRKRRQDKYQRQCERLSLMRKAKARIRQERIAAGLIEHEPKMIAVRHPHLSWAMRDDLSGEEVWLEFKGVRDMARRARLVAKFYQPGRFKI